MSPFKVTENPSIVYVYEKLNSNIIFPISDLKNRKIGWEEQTNNI